ncbi:MAG: hypothetical protein ABI333_06015 [bacterium]
MIPCARAALPIVAALALSAACGPVVWYGHSPDRRHRVRVLDILGEQRVHWDGRPGGRYRSIGVDALTFSPDSRRLAFPAECQCGRHWFVVLDGREGRCWHGIGEILFSPDSRRLAYAAQRGKKWTVVRDGRPDPAVDAVLRKTLRWSPDSRRLAYAAQLGKTRHVVVDGRVGPGFQRIAQLRLRGRSVAYLGQRGRFSHVVLDGVVGPPFDQVKELTLRPGARGGIAYFARRRGSWFALVDRSVSASYEGVAGMTFSQDGRHVAYAARVGMRAQVVLDGVPQPLFDGIRFQTLTFSTSGELLYIARQGKQYRVVRGGRPGPLYDAIEPPVARGVRWGYTARRDDRHCVVLNGRVAEGGIRARWVGDLVLSRDGGRHAYIVHRGERMSVVHGRQVSTYDVVVLGTLQLSRDGRHWACLAGDAKRKRLFVAVDGQRRIPFDTKELTAALFQRNRPPRSELLRRWVAAELERAASPRAKPPRPVARP